MIDMFSFIQILNPMLKNFRFFAKIKGRQIQTIAFRLIHPVPVEVLLSIHSIVCFGHFFSRWRQINRRCF